MSGLFDQVVNYSPPLLTSGQVNYDGTWNAATNTPTLVSPPDALSKGDYYVVSAAGTQFGISFAVGDWIISNGTAWEKVDLTDAVSSVFGRTGAVVGDSTDYSAVGITNTAIGAANPSTGAFTSLSSSSTTTLNGTTIPASKTLVVTTDKLSALAATTSAELAGVISDETGSGSLVFANSPTLVTPALGTPSSGTVTNLTGTASININGTVGATTPSTGAFTTLSATLDSTSAALAVRNTVAGAAKYSRFAIGNDTSATIFDAYAFSSTYTPSAWEKAGGAAIFVPSTGGLSLVSQSGDVRILAGSLSTVHGLFSSTGLAITGALSATGNTTIGSSGSTPGGFGQWVSVRGGSNGAIIVGRTTASNDALEIGWTTSAASLTTYTNVPINLNVNNATVGAFSSTGLAITGALSSTGALAIGNTVAAAVAVASTHKVTIVIGGVTYYLLATNV